MKRVDFARLSFISICVLLVFLYGVAVGTYQLFPHSILNYIKHSVVQVYEERRTLAKVEPELYLLDARYSGSGVTVNNIPPGRKDLIFLSGFFDQSNELRLIRRDGTIVARWPVQFSKFFPDTSHLKKPPTTDWNVEIHGAVMLPDGSVVFDFEYGGLVKLDRCGNTVWALAQTTHHSVERAEGGGYWVPAKRYYEKGVDSPFPPFKTPLDADTILRVSEKGEIVSEILVPEIFYKNGLNEILTSSNQLGFDAKSEDYLEIVHLNKVEELTRDMAGDFDLFAAGDLLLSFRGRNLVMVVDPRTLKVKWWRIGPWVRQHDPEFKKGGNIVVFNNNFYFGAGEDGGAGKSGSRGLGASNIVELDPVSGKFGILYGAAKGQNMLSVFGGKVDLTRQGGLMITEFDGGRVFETDAAGNVIWEYINRYDSKRVAKISEGRVYPESYFNVPDWSCSGSRK